MRFFYVCESAIMSELFALAVVTVWEIFFVDSWNKSDLTQAKKTPQRGVFLSSKLPVTL
jgi:hypothetical protein